MPERTVRKGRPSRERTRATSDVVTTRHVKDTAVRVAGSRAAGEAWFTRPNPLLGGRTPREATEEGQGKLALGILKNIAGT